MHYKYTPCPEKVYTDMPMTDCCVPNLTYNIKF